MSTIKVTNLRHGSATSNNIALDSSNNVTTANNFTAGGTIGCTGNLTVTSGNVVVSSGNGIDFSATGGPDNGTGSSELLDDYEEGTWTPEIADAVSGGNTVTHGVQDGKYTKVGNIVTCYFRITWSSKGSCADTSFIRVRNFPFTSLSNSGQYYYTGAITRLDGPTTLALQGNGTDSILYDDNYANTIQKFSDLPSSNTNGGINGAITYLAN